MDLSFLNFTKVRIDAKIIIAGISNISLSGKLRKRVNIRILNANMMKNIDYNWSRSERFVLILWLLCNCVNGFLKNLRIYRKCNLAQIPDSAK